MSTITVELIIKMKTKFTSSNAEKTNEKTNGFILPQMSNFHMERLLAATLVMPGKHAKSLSTSCVASPVYTPAEKPRISISLLRCVEVCCRCVAECDTHDIINKRCSKLGEWGRLSKSLQMEEATLKSSMPEERKRILKSGYAL